MNRVAHVAALPVTAALAVSLAAHAQEPVEESDLSGQGILWQLPEDGTWVEFAGTLQVTQQAEAGEPLQYGQRLRVASVGTVEEQGEMFRWIELRADTGVERDDGTLDPGPFGTTIYKVLVPESAVGRTTGGFLPIRRGYRRVGLAGEVETLEVGVLSVYPTLSLLEHYPVLEQLGTDEDVTIAGQDMQCTRLRGMTRQLGRTILDREAAGGDDEAAQATLDSRVVNVGEMLLCPDAPFGLAAWEVEVTQEVKETFEPDDAYRVAATFQSTMQLVASGTDAESELPVSQ